MELIFFLLAKVISITLGLVSWAMIARMILPIFTGEEGKIYAFCYAVTEPFVIPFRYIMVKLNIGQDLPIDLSFTFAYFAIALIQLFLPVI